MLKPKKSVLGITLIEMLLVMVIASSIIYMGIGYIQQRTLTLRTDRTAAQMQQILTAGLAYHVVNNAWPTDLNCLKGLGASPCNQAYLPSSLTNSPFGSTYTVASSASNFYVYTGLTMGTPATARGYATLVVGKLPLAYTANAVGTPPPSATCTGTTCYVVSSVNMPGQNLNNATAVNYAGLYHNGSCVPVPVCPADAAGNAMTAQILVVPASVTGAYEAPANSGAANCNANNISGCQVNAYPLNSFTASATAPTVNTPPSCGSGAAAACYSTDGGAPLPLGKQYWRVCLSVTTERGQVVPTTNPWGQLTGTVMAITRCVPQTEAASSGFNVWSQ